MASVSSLDQDMRNLRMSRYTPKAANEVRTWIETTLEDSLPPGDLLDVLKSGIVLCKLANMVLPPPGIKFKTMSMPFIQMENISHFLKACEMPPLNMPAHDRFLTVDLYEGKDPAQVLQCMSAFSRRANAVDPSRFPTTIGPSKTAAGPISPSSTGGGPVGTANGAAPWRQSASIRSTQSSNRASVSMPSARPMTPSVTGGSTGSQQTEGGGPKSPGPVSSWSKRIDEGITNPAWNIHQYGYMGGASQGNQGVSFGARRQITSAAPSVPNQAGKEKKRREEEAEEQRLRQEAEEAEYKHRVEREAEEERERLAEEQRWENETRRIREDERRMLDEQKRQWEAQEQKWKEEEDVRRKEDAELQATMSQSGLKKPPEKPRVPSSSILKGQNLSQWQKEQSGNSKSTDSSEETPEQRRVKELEKQLEEARERERQYQIEREERLRQGSDRSRPNSSRTETPRPGSARESEKSWTGDEREYLRQHWHDNQTNGPTKDTKAGAPPLPKPETESVPPEQPAPTRLQPHVTEPEQEDEQEGIAQPVPPMSPPQNLPQHMQSSDSTNSLSSSAPHSSPIGSANRPMPTPEKTYEPFTPSQKRPPGSPFKPSPFSRTPSSQPSTPQPTQAQTQQQPQQQQQQQHTPGPRISSPFSRTPSSHPSTPQNQPSGPRISSSREAGDTSLEQQNLRDSRIASQQFTKAASQNSKSLLEREMERERERQKEWESRQHESQTLSRDLSQGPGEGQSWDVNQYGYIGGDGQGKGLGSSSGSGIDMGGRRQILGPRAMQKK
ncbi:hypothetical protein MBLNU230_g3961t1 [Neophaeotheca triangularis]